MAARENGPTHKALALALSHANACNPLLQAHPPWAQDNTSRGSLSFVPPCVPSRADPSGLGHAATIYSSVQGPPGVETPTLVVTSTPPLSPKPAGERADHHAGGMQLHQGDAPFRLRRIQRGGPGPSFYRCKERAHVYNGGYSSVLTCLAERS